MSTYSKLENELYQVDINSGSDSGWTGELSLRAQDCFHSIAPEVMKQMGIHLLTIASVQ